MSKHKALIPILIFINLLMTACVYIVLPDGLDFSKAVDSKGWSAVVTGVSQTGSGDLHIDLTIRNDTGDWSTMNAAAGQPAVLTNGDGVETDCNTVFIGTGGHRLAPGFQMRGYIAGMKSDPKVQLIYVECAGVQADPGSKLTIQYISFTGEMDYYHQEAGESAGTIEVELDQTASDLTYPVFSKTDGLIQTTDLKITAISDNVISLVNVQRTEQGFEFKWQNQNPTEFALKVHIGNPPVICSDGIIYNLYEIMDLATTPLTPSKGSTEWDTKAAVPPDVSGCYILLSVESKNMRNYVSYAIDVTNR